MVVVVFGAGFHVQNGWGDETGAWQLHTGTVGITVGREATELGKCEATAVGTSVKGT
jgi:hypothetical protein